MRTKVFYSLMPYAFVILFTLVFTSCGALSTMHTKHNHFAKVMPMLELGMSKTEVMDLVQYKPDFISKEEIENGIRETFSYSGTIFRRWPQGDIPVYYYLVFENDRLVAVDTRENVEESIRRGFNSVSIGVVL